MTTLGRGSQLKNQTTSLSLLRFFLKLLALGSVMLGKEHTHLMRKLRCFCASDHESKTFFQELDIIHDTKLLCNYKIQLYRQKSHLLFLAHLRYFSLFFNSDNINR